MQVKNGINFELFIQQKIEFKFVLFSIVQTLYWIGRTTFTVDIFDNFDF